MAGRKQLGMTYGELTRALRELEAQGLLTDDSPVIMETPMEVNYTPIKSVNITDLYEDGKHLTLLRLRHYPS